MTEVEVPKYTWIKKVLLLVISPLVKNSGLPRKKLGIRGGTDHQRIKDVTNSSRYIGIEKIFAARQS